MRDIVISRMRGRGRRREGKAGLGGRERGRRPWRLEFDRLEARRLLSGAMPPVAEFPLRQPGGPEGVTEDASGDIWSIAASGFIGEDGPGGNLIAQYTLPSYNGFEPVSGKSAQTASELGLITYNAKDGDIWFYEANNNALGSLNPATGTISEYPLLALSYSLYSVDHFVDQIVAGPDGNIYLTEPLLNEIGVFDTQHDVLSQFAMPLADTQPQGIAVGADGNLWFTEGGQNKIGSLNPTTHVITNYAFEPPSYSQNAQAEGITAGPGDTIWFVETQNNLVQEFDLGSDSFTNSYIAYYPNPNSSTPPAGLWSISADGDGNIYYTEPVYGWVGYIPSGGGNGRIYNPNAMRQPNITNSLLASAATGSTVYLSAPSDNTLYSISAQSPGNGYIPAGTPGIGPSTYTNDAVTVGNDIWFTDPVDSTMGEIGMFDPANQQDTMFNLPLVTKNPENYDPNQITVDSNGNVWFTETALNAIGEVNLSSNDQIAQTLLTNDSNSPTGIVWDAPEKLFWITEPGSNQIVSYNPATSGSAVSAIPITDPTGILVDPTTGYLWIAEGSADQIINYDPIHQLILYTFSTKSSPDQLTWGSDHNIWFTESGYVGELIPPTGEGTGQIKTEIPVSGSATSIAAGPSGGSDAGTVWFTESNSPTIGEVAVASQTLVGYVTAPDTKAVSITAGPDGNMWFTSGQTNPGWMGAVVLNANDLGTQVVVTTQPPNVEETVFGGFSYGFGLVVSVENSQGQPDPFVQQGTITISLGNNPSQGTLGGTLTLPVSDGSSAFYGLTIDKPGAGYSIEAAYTLLSTATTSSFFNVTGPATQLVVSSQPPATVGAGVGFGVTITAEDANGLVVPDFLDPIGLTIAADPPGDGVLNGVNPLGALYGSAAFAGLSIDQAGVGYTLQAEDLSPGTTVAGATTRGFTITAGPATHLAFAASGEPPATAIAGQDLGSVGAPLIVDAEDQFGYTDTTFNGPVTIILADNASGALSGTTLSVDAVNGVAKFTSVAIDTAGTFQLEATNPNLTAGVSTSVTISAATAAQLVWVTQPPSTVTDASPFGAVLDIEDRYGNLETTDTPFVSIALDLGGSPDQPDLGGTTTVQASGGVATFTNLLIDAVNSPFTLLASSTGIDSSPSIPIDAVPPQLVVTGQPSGDVTAGSGFDITVSVETSTGAVITGFSGTLDLAIASGPGGATIGGTTSAYASAGVALFQGVQLDTSGTYFLQASGSDVTPGNSRQITVDPSPTVASLVIAQQPPGSVQAGTGFGLQVGGLDPYGNATPLTAAVTVAIKPDPDGVTLGGTLTATPSGGVAVFSGLTIDTAAAGYTIQATTAGATSATTDPITITPAAAYQLVVPPGGEPPSTVDSGASFTMTVDVEDRFGNLVPGASGTVTVSQPSAVSGTTSAGLQQGVASFTGLVIDTAGSYQLQATSGTLLEATSTTVGVVATSTQPASLAWATEPPGQVMHDTGFGAVVDVEDTYGNVETNFDGSVTIRLDANPGDSALGGTTTVAAVAGVATFSGLTLGADADGYTLLASTEGVTSGDSTPIDVSAIPPVLLEVGANPPSSVQDTQSFGLTVDVLDSASQPDPDFVGNVTVSISSPSGSTALTGTTTAAAVAGVATFTNLDLTQLGNFTLQVACNGLAPVTTSSIQVTAGQASQVVVVAQPPSHLTAGVPFGFEVQAEDKYGNLASSYSGLISASLAPNAQNASALGTTTAVASGGLAYFTGLLVDRAGSGYTFQVDDVGNTLTGATTSALSVIPNTPTLLEFSTPPPTKVTAGVPFSITVGVADNYGNVVSSYTGSVGLSLSNKQPAGPLGGLLTEPLIDGLATFPALTLDRVAGTGSSYTILAQSGGVSSDTSSPITVTPASAAQLTVSAQPPSFLSAGTEFGMAVTAEDAFGNIATGFSGPVTLALQGPSGPGTLSGGPLTIAAINGVASFAPDLAIHSAGSGFTIQATSPGLTPIDSIAMTITGLSPTHLAVIVQPPSTVASGASFGFVVAAEDQYGNVNLNYDEPITIALPPGAAGTLAGPLEVTANAGVASFQGLTLSGLTAPVSIAIASADLGSIATQPIDPVQTTITQPPPPPPLVTMTGVNVTTSKKHQVTGLLVTFSGPLNAGEASSTSVYELISAGKKNSFTAKNAKRIAIASAVYNASGDSVALTPSKAFAPTKPVELIVIGTGASGLEDSDNRLIDGNHDGQPGGNAVAILTKKGKTVGVQTMAIRADTVDRLLQHDLLARPGKPAGRPGH